jgi:hypothetical protein
MIDGDLAHRARREGEEVPSVAPESPLRLHEFEVRLVDERRRIQCVARPAACQLPAGCGSEFGIERLEVVVGV